MKSNLFMKWTGVLVCALPLLALAGCGPKCDCATTPQKAGVTPVGQDMGPNPWVVNIDELTVGNKHFRASQWTGTLMQMTVMSIPVGGQIGLELHGTTDQFLRVEQGKARVMMGKTKDQLDWVREVEDDFAIFVPAGWWHNIVNIGEVELKMYSLYTPPNHPKGAVHKTFEESEAAHEHDHDHDHDHGHEAEGK